MSDAPTAKSRVTWRGVLWDAVVFWEPARLAYNAVLDVTAWVWAARLEEIAKIAPRDWLLSIAVVNLLYTAVYPVDLYLQLRRDGAGWRPTLWFAGTFVVWTVLNMIFWLMRIFGGLVADYR